MATMIHQNRQSENGTKPSVPRSEQSLRSLVEGASAPAARGTSAPARKRPPPNNMGGKPVGITGGRPIGGLGALGLNAKINIRGAGPVHFKGFVLYRKDMDAYLFRMRTAGNAGVWSAVKKPEEGYLFPTFEAAAQGKPVGEAGWEVLALYDGKRNSLVMTL